MNPDKAIVLHDSFTFKGGGERLVHILCQELNLDLAYGSHSEKSYDLAELAGKCIDLKIESRVWGWRTLERFFSYRFKTRFLKKYATVIYSGQDAPLAVVNHPGGKNILYCHTPPRSLYDLKDYRLASLSFRQTMAHRVYNLIFQPLYEAAIGKMDVIIANSVNIQNRIKKYLHRDSVVVHPPCDTEKFHWFGQEDYYLSFARLDPLKRVDLIVKAFTRMPDKRLIIASSGPELEKLKHLAEGHRNISFTGLVGEDQLIQLMGQAIATIYIPKDEDFGMSAVESMAAGKPVLGVAEGGLLETIVHDETGILIESNPSPENIVAAVEKLNAKQALSMRPACEKQAAKFSQDIFLDKMRALINGK